MLKRLPVILILTFFILSVFYTTVGSTLSSNESYLYDKINEIRISAGLYPLNINDLLVETARNHSHEMVDHDYFNHISPVDGSAPYDRVVRSCYYDGYYGMRMVSENIAWTWPGVDVDTIVEAWMESPGHRSNILSNYANEIGVGIEAGTFKGMENTALFTAVFAYKAGASTYTLTSTTSTTTQTVNSTTSESTSLSSLHTSSTLESTSLTSPLITTSTLTVDTITSTSSTIRTTYQQTTQTSIYSTTNSETSFTTITSKNMNFTTIKATLTEVEFPSTPTMNVLELKIISNSSISNVLYDQKINVINFTITGMNETRGFCNATIPKNIIDGPPIVFLDGKPVNYKFREDAGNYYIYFTYNHSSHDVTICGSNTIPELHHIFITFFVAVAVICLLIRKHADKRIVKKG